MIHGAVFQGTSGDGGDDDRHQLGLADWNQALAHPEVGLHVDQGGRSSLHRKGVLVLAAADFDDPRMRANLADLGVDRDEFEYEREGATGQGLGFGVVRLGGGVSAVEAGRFLRALEGRRPLRVGPDHLISLAQGRLMLSPAAPPEPDQLTYERQARRQELAAVTPVVPVAVIDSGLVEPVLATDPLLRAGTTAAVAADALDPFWDGGAGELRKWDGGHGTFVAGVLAEASQGTARLVHYGVCRPIGGGGPLSHVPDTEVARAVSSALGAGCRVINLSMAGPTALNHGTLATALVMAQAAGSGEPGPGGQRDDDAVVVAAAGNEGTSQPMYPAALKGVVAVGAVESSGSGHAPFSNFGPWVDCCARGVDVFGPYVTGRGGPVAGAPAAVFFDGWATWSGTSFATPYVAGLIARAIAGGITSARVAAASVLAGGLPLDPALGLGVLLR